MKRGEKFLTILVLIVLVSAWILARPQIIAAAGTVQAARRPTASAPATSGAA